MKKIQSFAMTTLFALSLLIPGASYGQRIVKNFSLQGNVAQNFDVSMGTVTGARVAGDVMTITQALDGAGGTESSIKINIQTNGTGKYDLFFGSQNNTQLRKGGTSTRNSEFVPYTVKWNGRTVRNGAKIENDKTGALIRNNTLTFKTNENRNLKAGVYSDRITITAMADAS